MKKKLIVALLAVAGKAEAGAFRVKMAELKRIIGNVSRDCFEKIFGFRTYDVSRNLVQKVDSPEYYYVCRAMRKHFLNVDHGLANKLKTVEDVFYSSNENSLQGAICHLRKREKLLKKALCQDQQNRYKLQEVVTQEHLKQNEQNFSLGVAEREYMNKIGLGGLKDHQANYIVFVVTQVNEARMAQLFFERALKENEQNIALLKQLKDQIK